MMEWSDVARHRYRALKEQLCLWMLRSTDTGDSFQKKKASPTWKSPCCTIYHRCFRPVTLSYLGREQKYEEGIALLRNTLANQSDCMLHRMLGDFLVAVNEYQEAMDQYSIALR